MEAVPTDLPNAKPVFVAAAALQSRDLDGAMQHFEAYRDIAQHQAAASPADAKWVLELAFGHSNVAAIHGVERPDVLDRADKVAARLRPAASPSPRR